MLKKEIKLVSNNKKARHDYFIDDTYEAGLSLTGTEIKSVRAGKVSIKEGYAKVEHAKVLLQSTDLSVREIAEKLAFNTVNYFIQSFRETTGYTPAQYRGRFK